MDAANSFKTDNFTTCVYAQLPTFYHKKKRNANFEILSIGISKFEDTRCFPLTEFLRVLIGQ
jgi:hypothetical protein